MPHAAAVAAAAAAAAAAALFALCWDANWGDRAREGRKGAHKGHKDRDGVDANTGCDAAGDRK